MNCKPGDLAVIVASIEAPQLVGRFVRVLYAAPVEIAFRLPDQHGHAPVPAGWWVCEFQNPVHALLISGGTRVTRYAPIPDCLLRPIRDPGPEAMDETLTWKPAPLLERECDDA